MSSASLIGWIGAVLFAICAVPQAWQSFRQGHSQGISAGFLALWFGGEVLTLAYILPKKDGPLLLNYTCNLICLLIIIRYRLWPRTSN